MDESREMDELKEMNLKNESNEMKEVNCKTSKSRRKSRAIGRKCFVQIRQKEKTNEQTSAKSEQSVLQPRKKLYRKQKTAKDDNHDS